MYKDKHKEKKIMLQITSTDVQVFKQKADQFLKVITYFKTQR